LKFGLRFLFCGKVFFVGEPKKFLEARIRRSWGVGRELVLVAPSLATPLTPLDTHLPPPCMATLRQLTHCVVGTSFQFYTDDEIRRLSVKAITNPQVRAAEGYGGARAACLPALMLSTICARL